MKRLKNSTYVYQQLLDRLKEYCIEHGAVFTGRQCNCIFPKCNHKHDDKNKSAGLVAKSGDRVLHCFTSGASGNIFSLAEEIEGLPSGGAEFFSVTLPTLAKRYGIKLEYEEVTDPIQKSQIENTEKNALFIKACHHIFLNNVPKAVSLYADKRGLQPGQFGGIEDVDMFLALLTKDKWTKSDVEAYLIKGDLSKLIGSKEHPRIILPLCDDYGNVVSFVSRKILDSTQGPKYINGINSYIYNKSEVLFNFNIAKKFDSIYIVEGQLDAMTLVNNSINNVVALSGSAFTDQHYHKIISNFEKIIFAMDDDDPGVQATLKHMERVIQACPECMIRTVIATPDPDEFVRANGHEAFLRLATMTKFEFILSKDSFEEDKYDKIQGYCRQIALEKSMVNRSRMIDALTKVSGMVIEDIRDEIDSEIQKLLENIDKEVDKEYEQFVRNARKTKDKVALMKTFLSNVESLKNSRQDAGLSYKEKIKGIEAKYKDKFLSRRMKLGRFKNLEKTLNGLPNYGIFIGIEGNPSHGKSSLMRQLLYEIIASNEDTITLMYTLDDAADIVVPIFVSYHAGVPLYKVQDWEAQTPSEKKKVTWAWKWLVDISDRFVIRESKDFDRAVTPEMIEQDIKVFKRKNPGKRIVVFVDSLHKLIQTNVISVEMRQHFFTMSQELKKIGQRHDVPVIVSLNTKKNSGRPGPEDIAETNQIFFDLDVLLIVYNEIQNTLDTKFYWLDSGTAGLLKIKPIIEVEINKNKLSGRAGRLFLYLDTEYGYLSEMDSADAFKIKGTAKTARAILESDPNARISS